MGYNLDMFDKIKTEWHIAQAEKIFKTKKIDFIVLEILEKKIKQKKLNSIFLNYSLYLLILNYSQLMLQEPSSSILAIKYKKISALANALIDLGADPNFHTYKDLKVDVLKTPLFNLLKEQERFKCINNNKTAYDFFENGKNNLYESKNMFEILVKKLSPEQMNIIVKHYNFSPNLYENVQSKKEKDYLLSKKLNLNSRVKNIL